MDTFTYIVIPILIFIARVIDVSFGTMRVIFVAKGFRGIAPVIGFFEVLIWLLAFSQVMVNLTNWVCYFAYAFGFASGTYVGIIIEEKISMGKVMVRIISKKDASELLNQLKLAKYNVTGVEAEGNTGRVKLIFTIIDRKHVNSLIKTINKYNPSAFYTIEDVRYACEEPVPKKVWSSRLFKKK